MPGLRPQTRWDAAKQQALRQLSTQRYPTGRIGHTLADIDPETNTAVLTVTLQSGQAYQLGDLAITGLKRYDAELVQRLARLQPGVDYDQKQLVDAQLRLSASGFFDSAFVNLDPSTCLLYTSRCVSETVIMLIDFFYTLRAAKLPVSVKEFLTLLEALKLGVVGPKTPQSNDASEASGYKIDDFYFCLLYTSRCV